MITAKEANKKTFKSEKAKELLKEKHYQELLKKIEDKILERVSIGDFFVQLNTAFMYPFRDLIIKELRNNGYKAELSHDGAIVEYLIISWQ